MNSLQTAREISPSQTSSIKRFLYICKESGLMLLLPGLLYITPVAPLANYALSDLFNNYKKSVEGVIEKKESFGTITEISYVCDELIGIFCGKQRSTTMFGEEKTFNLSQKDGKIDFKHSGDFKLAQANMPSEGEINEIIQGIKDFVSKHPDIKSMKITGYSSPEGKTQESLTGKDTESYAKNKDLAQARANYLKDNIQKGIPELNGVIIEVLSIVRTLNESDFNNLVSVSSKLGFNKGNVQDFIKSFNKGDLNKIALLSDDERRFLANIFDRGAFVNIQSKDIHQILKTEYISDDNLRALFYVVLICLLSSFVGTTLTRGLYVNGKDKIRQRIVDNNTSIEEKNELEFIYFGNKLMQFREYYESFEKKLDSIPEGNVLVFREDNMGGYQKVNGMWVEVSHVGTYFKDKEGGKYYSIYENIKLDKYDLILTLFENKIDEVRNYSLDELNELMGKNFVHPFSQ